jgi:hypothetical protein
MWNHSLLKSLFLLVLCSSVPFTTVVTSFVIQTPTTTFGIRTAQRRSFLPVLAKTKLISDHPLASLMSNKLPKNFTLAATPENVISLQENQRLVCLGDIHGDFKALQDFLEISGVVSSSNTNEWIGNNTILVQCGDVLDRGSQELACFQLLAQLSHQAEQQGGKVILLLGNHEAMNAMGLFQYATTDLEYEQVVGTVVDDELQSDKWRLQYVGNQPARWASYEPKGLLANSLMANMKVAVQVGKTICVHAGLTKEHLQNYGGIAGMNQQAHDWFVAMGGVNGTIPNVTYNHQGAYDTPGQPWFEAEARQTYYINSSPPFLGGGIGATAPLWMRDYSSPNDQPPKNPEAQAMMDACLNELNCDRMVMGHTVQRQINCALNGKAWRVDTGVSRGVIAGTPEVLEVVQQNGTEVVSVMTKTKKIPAKERQILAMANFF